MIHSNLKYFSKASVVLLLMLMGQVSFGQKKQTAKQQPTVAAVKKIKVTGVVTDHSTNKPLAGITVGFGDIAADLTDEKGFFSINVPSLDVEIYLTGEGFEPRQFSLKGKSDLQISMIYETGKSFQQNAILPQGAIPLRNNTAAIGLLNVNGNWNRPFESIDELLQGQVAGLQSIRRSGATSKGANLMLRGQNSLHGTNMPLLVVDGMLFDPADYGNSLMGGNYTNPLSLINSQDIDNVSVIKDASSEYGSKGANGAIIITTARAKRQATSIDFGIYGSYNQMPDQLPLMDASSYRTYLSEILQSKGLGIPAIGAMPFMRSDSLTNSEYFKYHNNTNWQDKVLRNSINKNYFLKVTGGDNIATYALSIGFTNMEGVLKSNNLTRYNTRFNAAFNFSKRLTGQANLAFTYNEQDLRTQGIDAKTSPLFVSLTKSPLLLANEVNAKGVLSPNLEDTDIFGVSNPSALIERAQGTSKNYRFAGSYTFTYDLAKSLKASTMIGIFYDKNRENIFIPRKGVADDTLSNAIADSRLGTQVRRLFSTYFDAKLEHSKTINDNHQINSRVGLRYQKNAAEQDFTLGYNSATDELISVQNGVNALRRTGGGINEWNWMNSYFSTQYGYKERFFLTFNAAMDGSSRFGSAAKSGLGINGVRYSFMPSLGAAWIVSSGSSYGTSTKVDLFKFRATLSRAGNDDIGNYTARQTYTSQNFLGMQGLVRSGIPNPSIQWETSTKANLGVDVAFWNDRVAMSVDLYSAKTTDMLVYEKVLSGSGFENVLTNGGAMRNSGFEAMVNVRAINKSALKWDLGFNYATNRNKILKVPNEQFLTNTLGATIITQTGATANVFYGYKTVGVFKTTTDAVASGLRTKNANGSLSNFQGGDIQFVDLNGDRIIDEKDMQQLGSSAPRFHGSFSSKLSWAKFTLDALFTFSQGNEVFNQLRYYLESASSTDNQLNSVVNRWRTEGQVTNMPKASFGDPRGNNRFSDRWIEDGSYLRLRNITLSYDLSFKEKFVKNATVYLTGNNLLTFTKYMGFDPEFSAGNAGFAQGIDTGLDPLFRSVTMGVRIGL
jgi:TonB-linked SusC/RagA family outer membrane protein